MVPLKFCDLDNASRQFFFFLMSLVMCPFLIFLVSHYKAMILAMHLYFPNYPFSFYFNFHKIEIVI